MALEWLLLHSVQEPNTLEVQTRGQWLGGNELAGWPANCTGYT